MTTHSPITLDRTCKNIGERKVTRDAYYAQAACAVDGMVGLLDALRREGIYDNTTIILMADHGASISGAPPAATYLGKISPLSSSTGGRFSPLFMVKPAHATGGLELSDKPLQLSDLRATLCELTKCGAPVPGISALGPVDPSRKRPILVYGADAHRFMSANDRLPETVEKRIIGPEPDALRRAFEKKADPAPVKRRPRAD